MRYDIRLKIDYSYQSRSDRVRNLLHVHPLDIPGRQSVSASLLTVDPVSDECSDRSDFFGNRTTHLAYHRPIQSISLSLAARVDRQGMDEVLDLSPPLSQLGREIAAISTLLPRSPHHFTAPSRRAPASDKIADYARASVGADCSTFEAMRTLGRALHRDMEFDRTATDVDTPPEKAFAAGRGVCQDFSHILIVALRTMGIPAGYVSGFLRTNPPEGQPRLEGADAMHAWVAAWCGQENGWIEYDPTNDLLAGQDHVTVAFGRDYGDIAPVKGVIRTSGKQQSVHSVDMRPIGP